MAVKLYKTEPTVTDPTANTVSQSFEDIRKAYGSTPTTPTAPTYQQSPADQLRRAQAWKSIQTGREQAGLTPAELQAMKNNIANTMSSESSSAERLAREAAARAGTAGGGAADRRLQELAAMNQAKASSMMSQAELDALQKQKDRELQYSSLGAETASQFGQDELGYASLGEQAMMDRLKLGESARQADMGNISDIYKWQNELDLANRYRTQERSEYLPMLEDIYGQKIGNTTTTGTQPSYGPGVSMKKRSL